MSMKYPYRDLGVPFDRNFRNDLNANFDDIEHDIRMIGGEAAQQALEAAHEAETQAIYAQTSGDYANDKGDYAAQQGDYAQTQGNYAKSQGDYAKAQGDYAKSVADANKTRLLTPVATFADIATTYPNPQFGDTVQTLDDGKFYRYEGGQWNFKEQYTSTAINSIVNELSKQNKQSVTIGHGLNVINASQNSPLDVRIEGRTLVNVSQNVLDPAKYYVLADKKSKVKFSDGTTYAGVAKFQGRAEKPILIRVSNFENKVSGSTVENPHVAKGANSNTSLQPPSSGGFMEFSSGSYSNVYKQDGTNIMPFNSVIANGNIAQVLFSFNIIEAIERNVGKIPASDTAGKVTWLKNNIAKLTCNWWGYGSSPSGNKATISLWNGSTWVTAGTHGLGSIQKLSTIQTTVSTWIDSNGFVYLLAYADPSDGTIPSTINTDYVELEIELNQNAQLWNPRFPLYEVDATEYANILTVWDENEVMRRYPMVESVQHVQNPYVIIEGENLLPPFTEWNLHANARVKSPYELELNATGAYQYSYVDVKVLPNTSYTFTGYKTGKYTIAARDANGTETVLYDSSPDSVGTITRTITTLSNTVILRIFASNNTVGTHSFSQPMLTLGSTAKSFVPKNALYLFAEVKLGSLGDKKDILWKDGQDWKVTKWIEKSETLTITNNTATLANNAQADTAVIVDESTGEIYKRVVTLSGSGKEFTQGGSGNKTITFNAGYVPATPKAHYVLATPKTEVVTDKVEGDLVVNGATQVEVGSGVIVREKANPKLVSTSYRLNHIADATTAFKNKASKILKIFKNTIDDTKNWVIEENLSTNGTLGTTRAYIDQTKFDTSAEYTVTYLVLDRHLFTTNVLSVTANYDASLKSVVDDVVAKQSDIAATVSVNVRAIAELYKRIKALGG